MNFHLANLKDYPDQPIRDFAKARNWFIEKLPDSEYVLFVSDHEEVPNMLLDYISRLEPKYPYYKVRVMIFEKGILKPLSDPDWKPNLCSNKMRFKGKIHEHAHPLFSGGFIDVPMLHNSDGTHSYSSWQPKWHKIRETALFYRLLTNWRQVIWFWYGRGLFRVSKEKRRH